MIERAFPSGIPCAVPGIGPAPRFRRAPRFGVVACLVAILCLVPGGDAFGQSPEVPDASVPPSLGAEGVVAGELRLTPSLGRVRGSGIPFLRAVALLHVSPRIALGGEAVVPVAQVRTTPAGSPDRSDLQLHYGGIRVSYLHPSSARLAAWSLSLLLGTGTARVTSSILDTEIGNDNFLILEPSVSRSLGAVGPLRIGVGAAYRIPLGAESLPGVPASALRGASINVSIGLRRDP